MAVFMRGTLGVSTHNPTIKIPRSLERQALANCDYTYTSMATTKGSRAQGKKRKKRGSRQAGASRWKERVQGGLRILQAPELAKLPWLVHGFSTRVGGVSKLDGKRVLNLGFTEWDARENVKENRARLQAAGGAKDLKRVWRLH